MSDNKTELEQAVINAAFKWYKQEDDTWWHEDICDCGACDLARAVIDLKDGMNCVRETVTGGIAGVEAL